MLKKASFMQININYTKDILLIRLFLATNAFLVPE
jgi:hypothetical protein